LPTETPFKYGFLKPGNVRHLDCFSRSEGEKELIIAIPVFGSEVSPRFDCAKRILLAHVEEGRVGECQMCEMIETHPLHWAKILTHWKVQQVICGGIDDFSLRMLNGLGIRVNPWRSGNARQVLEKFLVSREEGKGG
jgi:predicted Fe-Mo cluster-binding NifX family protein